MTNRILLFPLANVLGHLTRTLALAEALHAQGDEVHVVLSRAYGYLKRVLPPGLRLHSSPAMHAARPPDRDPIASYEEGPVADHANLDRSSRMSASDSRRRSVRLKLMIESDAAILRDVRPDVVVTDWRFTPVLSDQVPPGRLFHLTNLLGYPSFFRRLSGKLPFPLESGRLLVPGIPEIEYRDGAAAVAGGRESLCGPFRWDGWKRMTRDEAAPPAAEVSLCFGSTGNSGRIVPWLLASLAKRFRVSAIAARQAEAGPVGTVDVSVHRDLQDVLPGTVALCHGGHGTVMECILHRAPMIVFPCNIEQLEIGRQVERMGIGRLVARPYRELGGGELADMIDSLKADSGVQARLEGYSAALSRRDGAREAASVVRRSLAEG